MLKSAEAIAPKLSIILMRREGGMTDNKKKKELNVACSTVHKWLSQVDAPLNFELYEVYGKKYQCPSISYR